MTKHEFYSCIVCIRGKISEYALKEVHSQIKMTDKNDRTDRKIFAM